MLHSRNVHEHIFYFPTLEITQLVDANFNLYSYLFLFNFTVLLDLQLCRPYVSLWSTSYHIGNQKL